MNEIKNFKLKGVIDVKWLKDQCAFICIFKREIRVYRWSSMDTMDVDTEKVYNYLSNTSNLKRILFTGSQIHVLISLPISNQDVNILDPVGISEKLHIQMVEFDEQIVEKDCIPLNIYDDIEFYIVDGDIIYLSDMTQQVIYAIDTTGTLLQKFTLTSQQHIKGLSLNHSDSNLIYLKGEIKDALDPLSFTLQASYENLCLVHVDTRSVSPLVDADQSIHEITIPSIKHGFNSSQFNMDYEIESGVTQVTLLARILEKLNQIEAGQQRLEQRITHIEKTLNKGND